MVRLRKLEEGIMKEKQTMKIKDHLERNGRITPMVALNRYGCMRLASRIFELRDCGMEILTNRIKLPDGSYCAEYVLKNKP